MKSNLPINSLKAFSLVVLYLFLIGHRDSAERKKNASYRRYKKAEEDHKYNQEKVLEYNAQLEQLAQSMADSQHQLSIYSGNMKKCLNKIRQSIFLCHDKI